MCGTLCISLRVTITQPLARFGTQNGETRVKRSTLANIHCSFAERNEVYALFQKQNPELHPDDLIAEFKYSEYL